MKELSEYQTLCDALGELQKKYLLRKQELRQILAKTAALRSSALVVIVKANRLTRHLTGRQRQIAGVAYRLNEITMRINKLSPIIFQDSGAGDDGGHDWQTLKDCRNLRELKQKGLLLLSLIDDLRKKLLQLDILELRCRELMLSTDKAMEAFRHESRIIHRTIYPFGIFSLFYRTLRGLWGSAYFTLRDMESIAALGNITGHVLKIADSPII